MDDYKYQVMTDRVTMDNGYLRFIAGIREPDLDSRICIQIPSFRDEELLRTMESFCRNAANPDRLTFAVCFQDDDSRTLSVLQDMPDCRVYHIPSAQAPGLCAARYLCSRMLADEEYVLHTDSHMRAARYWDVAMIHMWQATRDEKAILSSYPLDYATYTDRLSWDDVFTQEVRDTGSFIGTVSNFNAEGTIRFKGLDRHRPAETVPGIFISGGCVFAKASLDRDCPSDPDMFFVADEAALDVRYFTHGYNIYHPAYMPFWHWYGERRNRDGSPVKRFNTKDPDYIKKRITEERRIRSLFGLMKDPVDLNGFGLGRERTLQDFCRVSGVDFLHHACLGFSKTGRYFEDQDALSGPDRQWHCHPISARSGENVHVCTELSLPEATSERDSTICVRITGTGDELLRTVLSLRYQAAFPERIRFCICLPESVDFLEERCRRMPLLKKTPLSFLFLPEDAYGKKAWSTCQFLSRQEDYVLCTDSDSVAVRDWDIMLIRQLSYLSDKKAVISVTPPDLGPARDRGFWRGSFDLPHAAGCPESLHAAYQDTREYDTAVPVSSVCGHYLFARGILDGQVVFPDSVQELPALLEDGGFRIYAFHNCYLLHDDRA